MLLKMKLAPMSGSSNAVDDYMTHIALVGKMKAGLEKDSYSLGSFIFLL
jgi:hypothetical protein